jgi:hypothetical protein
MQKGIKINDEVTTGRKRQVMFGILAVLAVLAVLADLTVLAVLTLLAYSYRENFASANLAKFLASDARATSTGAFV